MTFIRNFKNQNVINAVNVIDKLPNGSSRLDRASKDIDDNLTNENLGALQVEDVLVKIKDRINSNVNAITHLTTEVIDVASDGNDVMGVYTKLVNNDDDDETNFNIEKSTIAENLYDRTHCNSNYETYVNCKDFTSDFTVRGDYNFKGTVIGDSKREHETIGNHFLEYISRGNVKETYKRDKDFDYSLNVSDNYKDKLLVGGDYEKRSEIEGDEMMVCDVKGSVVEDFKRGVDLTENLTVGQNFLENTDITGNRSIYWKTGGKMIREHTISGDRDILCDVKGSVVEDFKRGVDLTENLTVGQNFLENTDITGNRSIYWKTGGKMIREHTISGDRDILCDVKGSVVEDFKRGVDLTENLTVGKDYVKDEKINGNKTVNNTINGSLNNKTIVRETETSFKRVNGSQTIKVVVDEYDEVLVIRNGKNKNGPKKGYYKYKNVKIGDEELLVLCRCNAECKK